MTVAHAHLRDLGLPPRDAEQTELHPHLNRAHVRFINLGKTYDGSVHALQGIDLAIQRGEVFGIIGRSGAGKSSLIRTINRLEQPSSGRVLIDQVDIGDFDEDHLVALRRRIGMIFQDPMSSLNPTMTIGDQIAETLKVHRGKSDQEAFKLAVELLERTHIPEAPKRAKQYPFEFSGGMLQRAMIAQSLACNPAILIADEPTTALDVTIQAQILELMLELQRTENMSIILITHDLEEAIALGDRVVVLSSGPASRVVRSFDVDLERPRNVAEIKLDERFTDLYRDIWACLRGEVEKSYARQD